MRYGPASATSGRTLICWSTARALRNPCVSHARPRLGQRHRDLQQSDVVTPVGRFDDIFENDLWGGLRGSRGLLRPDWGKVCQPMLTFGDIAVLYPAHSRSIS